MQAEYTTNHTFACTCYPDSWYIMTQMCDISFITAANKAVPQLQGP